MTNREIRQTARARYKSSENLFFVAALTASILPILATIAAEWMTSGVVAAVLIFAVGVVSYPLTIGAAAYFLKSFEGKRAGLSELFVYYRDKQLLLTSLKLGVFMLAVATAFTILGGMFDPKSGAFPFLMSLLIGLLEFVFNIRVILVIYLYMRAPDTPAAELIKRSFACTKGEFLRVWGMKIMVTLPILILSVAMMQLSFLPVASLLMALYVIVIILLQTYIQMSYGGLSSELIPPSEKLTG